MADTPEKMTKVADGQYRRIGGGLRLFFLLLVVSIARSAWELTEMIPWLLSSDFELLAKRVPGFNWLVLSELFAEAVFVVIGVVGIVTTKVGSSSAPLFWRTMLIFVLLANLLDFLALQSIEPSFERFLDSEIFSQVRDDLISAQAKSLFQAAMAFIWLLYWIGSRRVANTFSHADWEGLHEV
jgi:hypothetical protein